jgi:LacI family transcriptional regulator
MDRLPSPPALEPPSPLVLRVVAGLSEKLRSGGFGRSLSLPSERAIAAEFEVSRTIVRQALIVLEGQGAIQRAKRRRAVLGTRSGLHRASTGVGRRTLGAWIWPGTTDPGAAALLRSMNWALDSRSYRLVIGSPDWFSWEELVSAEARFVDLLVDDADCAGAIIWHSGADESLPALRRLTESGIALVFVDRVPAGLHAHYVGVHNRSAAERVVRHLIERGHRRIAHISNGDHASTVADRLIGYRRALQGAGIALDPALIAIAREASEDEAPSHYGAMIERWRHLPEPPTAVFAVNDQCAKRFRAAARAAGLRIPDDIALAGFDGTETWLGESPTLTTAFQPLDLVGEHAIELLLAAIEEPGRPLQHVLLDAPLQVFESTAGEPYTSSARKERP